MVDCWAARLDVVMVVSLDESMVASWGESSVDKMASVSAAH